MNSPAPLWLRILAWLGVLVWASTIYYFSSLTGPEIQQIGIQLWDKAEHFVAFATGGMVLAAALCFSFTWSWKKIACFAIISLVLYGALDETHQLFTANRSGADPFDWLADSLGALTGVLLFVVIYARLSRQRRSASKGA